jgi:MFS family permease
MHRVAVAEPTGREIVAARSIRPGLARRLEPWVPWAIWTGFAAVLAVALSRHEMWRDELQAWMIARDSTSFTDLLHNIRYEGHPVLWYALLAPLSALRDAPSTMQILEWVVGVTTAGLVAWRAPFSNGQKAMLLAGYFPLYEYGVLSRAYGLGLLLVVAICALAVRRRPRPWPAIGILLALLALTSAFGAVLALALLAGLAVDEWLARRAGLPHSTPEVFGGSVAFAFAGLLYAYGQTIPPGDAVYTGWKTEVDAGLAASAVGGAFRAIAPIPRFTRQFWQTHSLDGSTWVMAILAVLLVGAFAWSLRRRPAAAAILLLGTGGTVAFMYGKLRYAAAPRHYGHVYLALLAAMWLAPAMVEWRRRDDLDPDAAGPNDLRQALFSFVLAIQVVAAMIAVSIDAGAPFSNAERTAAFLRARHLDDGIVISYPAPPGSSVAAYLGRGVVQPETNRVATFMRYDRAAHGPLPPLQAIVDNLRAFRQPATLVVESRVDTTGLRGADLLARFDDQIVVDEGFTVWRVDPRSG